MIYAAHKIGMSFDDTNWYESKHTNDSKSALILKQIGQTAENENKTSISIHKLCYNVVYWSRVLWWQEWSIKYFFFMFGSLKDMY